MIIDTCVFIYLALQPDKITKKAKKALAENSLYISEITFLELGFLIKKGRISIPCTLAEFSDLVMEAHSINILCLTAEIIEQAMAFSDSMNMDPADRIISATAVAHRTELITADKNLRKNDQVQTVW